MLRTVNKVLREFSDAELFDFLDYAYYNRHIPQQSWNEMQDEFFYQWGRVYIFYEPHTMDEQAALEKWRFL